MQRLYGVVPQVLVRLQRRARQDAQHRKPQLCRLPLLRRVVRRGGRCGVNRPVRLYTGCTPRQAEPSGMSDGAINRLNI